MVYDAMLFDPIYTAFSTPATLTPNRPDGVPIVVTIIERTTSTDASEEFEIGTLRPGAFVRRRELEDAARIDGCTRFTAFLRVLLPLATPGLAACGVILFVISWHELLIPLIVVNRPESMTLPVVLAGLVSDCFVFFTLMMAICLLGLLPTVALVLVLRRFIVRGLVAGALKG